MITDDPQDMEQKLTQYVKDARQALETLEELIPSNIIPRRAIAPGSEEEQYVLALNKLNTARTWLGIAAEQLHERLNVYHDRLLSADKDEPDEPEPDFGSGIPKRIRKGDERIGKRARTYDSRGLPIEGKVTAIFLYDSGLERIEVKQGTA